MQKLLWSNANKALLITGIVVFVFYLFYINRGIENIYLHFTYIPIILSAYFWEERGSIAVAVTIWVLLRILFLLDTSRGILLGTNEWVIYLALFSFIGSFAGIHFGRIKRINRKLHAKKFISPLTGFYNVNKLLIDLQKRMSSEEIFKVLSIKLTNIEGIEKYVNHNLVNIVIKKLVQELKHGCKREAIYSYSNDELILIICDHCSDYMNKIKSVINQYSNPINIDDYKLKVSMKIGMYEYHGEKEKPSDVFNKARIAYEQGRKNVSGIYKYDRELERKYREIYEISSSLFDAIKKDELCLVYQPIINISDHSINGVETLIRWDRQDKKPVSPNVFIQIAEEIGFNKQISKFVIENATSQIVKWKEKGIIVNCALNLTANELLDVEFVIWLREVVKAKKINKSILIIELTERVFTKECKKLLKILSELREKGYMISIDDFGTGYNSLIMIGEIPFDILKIDKYFIDRLQRLEIKELVRNIITYAHNLNKKIIAEGVETKEQLNILRELNCDCVQGYYYREPLLPQEFEDYYKRTMGVKKSIKDQKICLSEPAGSAYQ